MLDLFFTQGVKWRGNSCCPNLDKGSKCQLILHRFLHLPMWRTPFIENWAVWVKYILSGWRPIFVTRIYSNLVHQGKKQTFGVNKCWLKDLVRIFNEWSSTPPPLCTTVFYKSPLRNPSFLSKSSSFIRLSTELSQQIKKLSNRKRVNLVLLFFVNRNFWRSSPLESKLS